MTFPRTDAQAVSLDYVWAATFAASMVRAQHDHFADRRSWAVDDAEIDRMAEDAVSIADDTVAALARLRAREGGR